MIVILAGGTGSVKLVRGLAKITEDLSVISNVGDNVWLYGLYICPDIDTVTYGLAGVLDEQRGWGVKGDTFSFLDQLSKLGQPSWFSLGDRDLATHVVRTSMMQSGKSLVEITDWMRERLAVRPRIIPATNNRVETKILTDKGEMHLQEFWVREKGLPSVTAVRYRGVEEAEPSAEAIDAIRKADRIIIAPANPVSSIGPIVALDGIRKELSKVRSRVVAVSPLIGQSAVSGPAVKYMKAVGLRNSPVGIAEFYRDFVGSMVISETDHEMACQILEMGMQVYETNITMSDREDEVRLGQYLLSIGRL